MIITANDLKTRGMAIVQEKLAQAHELFISLRGKNKYVIIDIEQYNHFRETELRLALKESNEDIAAGRYTTNTEQHLKEIEDAL